MSNEGSPGPLDAFGRRLLEALPDAALLTDGTSIEACNRRAVARFQYKRSDLVGRQIDELRYDGPTDPSTLLSGTREEWTFVDGSGRSFPAFVEGRPVPDDGDFTLVVVRPMNDPESGQTNGSKVARLHDVAITMEAAKSDRRICEIAVDAADGILEFDTCVVSLAEGEELVTMAVSSGMESAVHGRSSIHEGIGGKTYRTGQTQIVCHVDDETDAVPARSEYRSAISVPIGDVGVLQAVSTSPNDFSGEDVELAELLATHASESIKRIRSNARLEDSRRKIAELHDIAARMESCERFAQVFDLAIAAAEQILELQKCTILVAEDERFEVAASSSKLSPPERLVSVDEGVTGRVYRTGTSEITDDIREDPEGKPVRSDVVAVLSVPIGDVGVFQAISSTQGDFDADDLELAELLMAHVSESLERIRSRRALERSRRELSSLIENLPGLVYRAPSATDAPTFVSEHARELTGYDPETLIGPDGPTLWDLVHRDDRAGLEERFVRSIEANETVEETYRIVTNEGDVRWVHERASAIREDGEVVLVEGVVTNVTDDKRREQLEVLNRVLRHNIRNEVSVARGYAAELAASLNNGELASAAEAVVERTDAIAGIGEKGRTIQHLLERDRQATNTIDLEIPVVKTCEAIASEFPEASISCQIDATPTVRANELLGRAIEELVENGVVHADADCPTVEVTVGTADDVGFVTIVDDGPGIPAHEIEVLRRKRETALEHGSGLGLWIASWIVDASHGELTFEREGQRTRVTIRLPLDR